MSTAASSLSSSGCCPSRSPLSPISCKKSPGYSRATFGQKKQPIGLGLKLEPACSQPFVDCRDGQRRLVSSGFICAAAMNARCGAEQTQTVTRQSSTITVTPIQGKEKSPELDDGGSGFPPRDDDGGGGGGGGGGGNWKGGFFFFGFLAFLGFLKDKEDEEDYAERSRR